MKRNILTTCAIALATSLYAQNYQVVVTTTDGERKVFATNDVSNIKFRNAPKYKEANTFIEGEYSPYSDNANYTFTIATEEPDSEGNPATIGGFQISFSLYGPLSEEAHKAILPDGYYRVGSATTSYTVNSSNSYMWIRLADGDDGITASMIVGGTVDVKHDGDNYDLRAEIDLLDGTHVDVSYYGAMSFSVGASGAVDFESDQNVKFTSGQGRVWANWFNPFCDDAALQFFTGKFTSEGAQTEGYYLYVPVYMEKDDIHTSTWSPVITDGVYTIDQRDKILSQTYLPNTIGKGSVLELFGSKTPMGTYLTYLAADGRVSMATITDGTMTVSNEGTNFTFDLTASNGIKVTGSYSKKPYVVNMIDNSSKPEYPDGLTGDYELNKFPSDLVVIDYNCGDYIVQGINTHVVMFTDPEQKEGDYLSLDLMSESEQIKDGEYFIDNSLTDMSGIIGVVNFQGTMAYSWYGDLDSTDDEGYQSILAPISGGKVTVSTVDGGKRKFDFDLEDLKGNKITGSVTKAVHYASDTDDTNEAKVERNRTRALGKVKRNWSKNSTDVQPRMLIMHNKENDKR